MGNQMMQIRRICHRKSCHKVIKSVYRKKLILNASCAHLNGYPFQNPGLAVLHSGLHVQRRHPDNVHPGRFVPVHNHPVAPAGIPGAFPGLFLVHPGHTVLSDAAKQLHRKG